MRRQRVLGSGSGAMPDSAPGSTPKARCGQEEKGAPTRCREASAPHTGSFPAAAGAPRQRQRGATSGPGAACAPRTRRGCRDASHRGTRKRTRGLKYTQSIRTTLFAVPLSKLAPTTLYNLTWTYKKWEVGEGRKEGGLRGGAGMARPTQVTTVMVGTATRSRHAKTLFSKRLSQPLTPLGGRERAAAAQQAPFRRHPLLAAPRRPPFSTLLCLLLLLALPPSTGTCTSSANTSVDPIPDKRTVIR